MAFIFRHSRPIFRGQKMTPRRPLSTVGQATHMPPAKRSRKEPAEKAERLPHINNIEVWACIKSYWEACEAQQYSELAFREPIAQEAYKRTLPQLIEKLKNSRIYIRLT